LGCGATGTDNNCFAPKVSGLNSFSDDLIAPYILEEQMLCNQTPESSTQFTNSRNFCPKLKLTLLGKVSARVTKIQAITYMG